VPPICGQSPGGVDLDHHRTLEQLDANYQARGFGLAEDDTLEALERTIDQFHGFANPGIAAIGYGESGSRNSHEGINLGLGYGGWFAAETDDVHHSGGGDHAKGIVRVKRGKDIAGYEGLLAVPADPVLLLWMQRTRGSAVR